MKAIILLFIVLIVLVGVAAAQQPGMVTRWTADGGGAAAQSATYRMDGTAGQPDAGTSSGGTYTANWGYWSPNPLEVIDQVENGWLALERDVTYGDLFKASTFLVLSLTAAARWMVLRWSLV